MKMSGAELAQIITSISTLCGVAAGIVVQFRNQGEARNARAQLHEKMTEVVEKTNGMSDKLSDAKLAQGTAEGTAVGLKEGTEIGLQQGREERRP